MERALASRRFGPYTLQAAIAAVHAEAPSAAATDWAQIVGLYDVLVRAEPSPVVELNRAVAVAMRDGPAAGLALIDAILARGELADYHLAHAARADLCRRLGKTGDARASYERALGAHPAGAGAALPRAPPGRAPGLRAARGLTCSGLIWQDRLTLAVPEADPMRMPLEDVKVLDLSHALAGPFCSTMLADFGAEVIKLEPRGAGDIARAWGPPLPGGETSYFVSLHRNKKGIEIDLKHPEGKELFFQLVDKCDVVLENYRVGALARLGLGYEAARERNPGIIYCSVSGFGQDGPYRDRAALDLILQAESGMISTTGEAGGHGVRCGVSIADMTAGMYAAFGIMLALRVKERTGRGQAIDVSMLEGPALAPRQHDRRLLRRRRGPAADGHRVQGAAALPDLPHPDAGPGPGGRQREALEGVLPRDRLSRADRRSALSHQRRPGPEPRHPDPARSRRRSSPGTYEEWEPLLLAQGIPMGAINTIPQVVEHPQVIARSALVEMAHPRAGKVRMVGAPVRLSETPGSVRTPAPLLGEHTDAVLRELLGLETAQIETLRAAGVIGPKP